MSDKIKGHHLKRKAILYVRQSSPYQVLHNGESRRLQYAMESSLKGFGWTQIDVIDEDLGRSAAMSADRTGFERMVAEVCLGHVGAVAAREVSRFARNSRDWQQLVEVCRMVDTLLIDQETIYDPRRGNDRLLLGLKGSLNEYELDILRLRSLEARQEKARRGELITIVSAGYVRTEDDRLVKDPDKRVQKALVLVFQKFLELGTVRQTLLWILEHDLEFPVRRHSPGGWEVAWRRPTYALILRTLRNPIYAGAYAYGKTGVQLEYQEGASRKRIRRKPMEQWLSLIYDHHEGYIGREDFERIQEMISKNSRQWGESGAGAARKGAALLSSLLRCRRCGRKLTVTYTGRQHDVQRYVCNRGNLDNGEPRCISLGGEPVDEAVAREVLRVVQPGAIEAATIAAEKAAIQEDDVSQALSLALQEARFAADRAHRQYDAVDPGNRLVADELESRWNAALVRVQELEGRLAEQHAESQSLQLPSPELFQGLAANLGQVWNDVETDVRLKKRILRTLIEEIIVDANREIGQVCVMIHWKGGVHTELRVPCRRRGQNRLHTPPETVEAVRILSRTCSDEVIAGVLNRNGLRTGRGNRWTRERVTSLRLKRRIRTHSVGRQKQEGWMTLTQAAAHLDLAASSLRHAVERGDVEALHPLPDGPWVLKRDHLDDLNVREALSRIRRRRRGGGTQGNDDISLFESTT
ncbi:MAG: recombinase family protein [Planctomycetota bacterium]